MDLLLNSDSNVNDNFYDLLTNNQAINYDPTFYSSQTSPFSTTSTGVGSVYLNDNVNPLNIDDFMNEWNVNNNFSPDDLVSKEINNQLFSNLVPLSNCSSISDNDSDSGVSSSDSPKPLNDQLNTDYQNKIEQFSSSSGSSVIELEDDSNQSNNQTIMDNIQLQVNNTDQLMLIDSSFYETELSSLMGSPPSVSSLSNTSCSLDAHQTDQQLNYLINDSNVDHLILDSDIANSEALLDNIEQMLKKMQDESELEQKMQSKPSIKQEPNETQGTVFKKISPKPSASIQTNNKQKVLLPANTKPTNLPVQLTTIPVLTVPSPASLQATNKVKIVPNASQISNNDLIQLLSKQTNQTVKKQPIIIASNQNQQVNQPLVLTIPTNNVSNTAVPIIIATHNPTKVASPVIGSSNKPIVIDDKTKESPRAKRLKQEMDKLQILTKTEQINSPLILTTNNLINNSCLSPTDSTSGLDLSLVKKQSRMIKNRESACLSRKRKKEYMQSLEDSLKDMAQSNEDLKKENQQLKEKCLILETENKLLKEQQKHYSVKVIDSSTLLNNKPRILTTLKTSPLNGIIKNGTQNVTSLKRPFIMLAVFMVFGLNMVQFISDNSAPQTYSLEQNSYINTNAAHLAALATAQANDGALIDLKQKEFHPRSRHLLSDYDYGYDNSLAQDKKKTNFTTKSTNLTKNDNSSLELVLINGTWHLIDLNICQKLMSTDQNDVNKFYNFTHLNKINNELNSWFTRHLKSDKNTNNGEYLYGTLWPGFSTERQNKHPAINSAQDATPYASSTRFKNHQNKRQLNLKNEKVNSDNYPVSVYNTQHTRYENFAKSVRQRNDTFYFINFRRDHIVFPALNQNKTKRPKISLMVPALLQVNQNDSQNKDHQKIAFMQIDCEVVDTRLFYIKTDDIPQYYMKILADDYIINEPRSTNFNRN